MTAADITQQAAKAFMNDYNQETWTDSVLLPYLAHAVSELEQIYRIHEVSFQTRVSVTILVTAGDLFLAQLPVDLIEPISLRERVQASIDDWSNELTEVDDVDPNSDTSQSVNQWAWRNGKVYINPPTTAREVRLFYTGTLTAIASSGSTIDDTNSKAYLSARTAQLAFRNGANNPSKAEEIQMDVDRNEDILIGSLVKENQDSGAARKHGYKGRHR